MVCLDSCVGFYASVSAVFVLAMLGRLAQTLSPWIGVTASVTFATLGVIAALLAVAWLWLGGE